MHRFFVALTMVALLAGCSSTPEAAPFTSSTSTAPTTGTSTTAASSAAPTSATPTKSARGLLVKSIGQSAGFDSQAGVDQATFTLDTIEVDPACTGPYPQPAERGHLIVLAFTVTTTPELQGDQGWYITAHDFALVGPDGITSTAVGTAAGFSCLADRVRLPNDPYAPGSKYVGRIALDVPHTTGVITYRPPNMQAGIGWEWVIPQ